jgi:hypothetical protein
MGEFDEISYAKAKAALTLANSLAGTGRTTENVKANADAIAAAQTTLADMAQVGNRPLKYRALYVGTHFMFTNSSYFNSLFEDRFQMGLIIHTCSYKALVYNYADYIKDYDLLIINTQYEISPHQSITPAEVVAAVTACVSAGMKLLMFAGDAGVAIKKYNVDGTNTTASLTAIIANITTGVQKNYSALTGAYRHGANYPFSEEILVSGCLPSNSFMNTFSTADASVVYPVQAYDDSLSQVSNVCAYKPGAFAIIAAGGNGGTVAQMSGWKYLDTSVIIRALLGITSKARLTFGQKKGRRIVAFGVDCDVTNDTEAITNIRAAIPIKVPTEWGLISDNVTAEIAGFFKGLYGTNRFVSHTKSHYLTASRITVTDEVYTIPSSQIITLKKPYKALLTSVKTTDDVTTFTKKSGSVLRTAPTAGQYLIDENTSAQANGQLQNGLMKFHADDVGKQIKISSTYSNEMDEITGSINALITAGILTDKCVYNTGGENSVSPTLLMMAEANDIVLCEYMGSPALSRTSLTIDRCDVPSPMMPGGPTAKFEWRYYLIDTEWFTRTKQEAKDVVTTPAIADCQTKDKPIVFYIHDFKIAQNSAGGVWSGSGNNADWKKATFELTMAYIQDMYAWLFTQLDALTPYWMTRSEYARWIGAVNKYVTYSVSGNKFNIRNEGKQTIKGLTAVIPSATAPSKVYLSNGAPVNYTYANGVITAWFDMLPGDIFLKVE